MTKLGNLQPFVPVLLFGVAYLAISFLSGAAAILLLPGPSMIAFQWAGLASVVAATIVSMVLYDWRVLSLGLILPPGRILRDLSSGLLFAAGFAVLADLVVMTFGDVEHRYAGALRAAEVLGLLIPAAVHEELLFRGYAFQKLLLINPFVAILLGAGAFTAIHLGNAALSWIGVANIFLAGVLLSLAFLARISLWFPIALHYAWNVTIGPILGHEVSGFRMRGTLFSTLDRGPELVTGGDFGVEGSVCVTVIMLVTTALMSRHVFKNRSGPAAVADQASPGVEAESPGAEVESR
jgi:membrane protease YdiL (CAAX protease family)